MQDEQSFLSFLAPGASLLDAALVYASLGLFVHPLRAGSKRPITTHGWHDATTKPERIKHWWRDSPNANIGVSLRFSSIAVIDVDPRNQGDQTLAELQGEFGKLPPTFTVRTGGGGLHYYYRVDDAWYDEHRFPKIIGPGFELLTNHYVVAPPSVLSGESGSGSYAISAGTLDEDFARFPQSWLTSAANQLQLRRYSDSWRPDSEDWFIAEGERDNTMAAIAGWARRMGANADEIEGILRVFLDRFESPEELEPNIKRVSAGMMRYAPENVRFNDLRLTMKPRRKEPVLGHNAFWGPIGEWAKAVEPYTETHPAALIAQALCAFGNIIGAKQHNGIAPGFRVEETWHSTGLYVNLIGDSAKAGKGDSWARVKHLMTYVDPSWDPVSGIQTGEGLIDALSDDQETDEKTTINGEEIKHVKKGGRRDRRYLVHEAEFGRVLHVASRQGSVIKDIYRELWDTGSTRKITAGSKQTVTGATVSLVGHITKPELERDFDSVDLMSGFGNRFLHIFTKRVRTLSNAPSLSRKKLLRYGAPLKDALAFAQDEAPRDYPFTDDAWAIWEEYCQDFVKVHHSPLVDALTARGRPLVRRMAVIFAVADCEVAIDVPHLKAAYALWEYSVQTIEYIFGSMIGDRDSDWLFRLILENRAGVTASEVYREKKGSFSKARFERAIKILIERGLIQVRRTKIGRKSVDVYIAVPEYL